MRDGAGTGIPDFLRLPEDNRVLGEEKQTPSVSTAAHTVDKLPLFHRRKELFEKNELVNIPVHCIGNAVCKM